MSYIGSTISFFAGATSPQDAATYGTNAYGKLGKVLSIGDLGDSHTDNTADYLEEGRTNHSNGTADGGEVPVETDAADGDAGYDIIAAANGTNDPISVKITDPDGAVTYFQCIIANLKTRSRTTTSRKGYSFTMRVNTGLVETTA